MLNIVTGVEKTPMKICIYGAEGVGKTSLAANMPEPLFIDTLLNVFVVLPLFVIEPGVIL